MEMNAQRTYHPARFTYVAIQRAPRIPIVKVEEVIVDHGEKGKGISGVLVTLECGHVNDCVAHFHYTVGTTQTCYRCGEAIAATLPEFAGATAESDE